MNTKKFSYTKEQFTILFGTKEKYTIVPKGRRFGLTMGAAYAFVEWMCNGETPLLWGDTIHGNIDRYFSRYFMPALKQLSPKNWKWNAQRRELLIGDSVCDFRSADRPENWEGFGYKIIFLNEAGIILKDRYLYENAVLPMMLDYPESRLIAGGVPKGKTYRGRPHLFYELAQKGYDPNEPDYTTLKYTSYDNHSVSKKAVMKLVKSMDSATASQEIFAEFLDRTSQPFAYAFDRDKHTGPCRYNDQQYLYLSFDFNRNPICCSLFQHYFGHIYCIETIKLQNSNIYRLCETIKQKYPRALYIVCGDASGANKSALVKDDIDYFKVIKLELKLGQGQMQQVTSNPRIEDNQVLVNTILEHYPITIDPQKARALVFDLEFVEMDAGGGLKKADRNDPTQQADALDTFRYYLNRYFRDFVRNKV